MVICAESANELQNMLNTLSNHCTDWDLEELKLLSFEMVVKHSMRKRGHLMAK